jgi:hypothetical protein
MEKLGWKLDNNNHKKYIDLCRRSVADEQVFAQFRNMDPMTMIVENSPLKSGRDYLSYWLKSNWKSCHILPQIFAKYVISDMVGSPTIHDLGGIHIAPTTMRDVKTLFDLEVHFGALSGLSIAEIGAGYGGLCKVVHDSYKPSDYYLFDLPEPLALQKKFLSKFGITPVTDEYPEQIDLLIAMYSWSELSDELQDEYLSKVISKAKNCYIMLNYDIEGSYKKLRKAFPNADIKDYHILGDESITDYAPYDRYIIIKN